MFKGRVLYWGGDDFLADLTSMILEKRDYEVSRAATLEDLLGRAGGAKPHLVVIDQIQARSESSVAGCRTLRESFTGAEIPVLFLVREGTESVILEFMDAGADECLAIPYKPAELLAKATLLVRKTCREEGRWCSHVSVRRRGQDGRHAPLLLDAARRVPSCWCPAFRLSGNAAW